MANLAQKYTPPMKDPRFAGKSYKDKRLAVMAWLNAQAASWEVRLPLELTPRHALLFFPLRLGVFA